MLWGFHLTLGLNLVQQLTRTHWTWSTASKTFAGVSGSAKPHHTDVQACFKHSVLCTALLCMVQACLGRPGYSIIPCLCQPSWMCCCSLIPQCYPLSFRISENSTISDQKIQSHNQFYSTNPTLVGKSWKNMNRVHLGRCSQNTHDCLFRDLSLTLFTIFTCICGNYPMTYI